MSTTAKSQSKARTTKAPNAASISSEAKSKTIQAPAPTSTKVTETRPSISASDRKTPPARKAAASTVVNGPQLVILGPEMRKKELIETVVTRSGMKKKDAKPIVDAMLAVLGEALADNRELVIPPFGRVKIRREKKLPNGRVLNVKIRQTTPLKNKEES